MIKITLPMTGELIKKNMQKIVAKIQEETEWNLERELKNINVNFGKVPEYHESFGVIRSSGQILFGNWLDEVKVDYHRRNLWEFLLIRESFSLFLSEKIVFGPLKQLTNFILNILAIAFLEELYQEKALEIKFASIKSRFLLPPEALSAEEKLLYAKIDELLISIKNQTISYKLILSTFKHFVNEDFLEFDAEELLSDLSRYLSSSPEKIAAPIWLRKNTAEVLKQLIVHGYGVSSIKIAKEINVTPVAVSRQINKIESRFYAKFRAIKNWFKLGLHNYLIFIRFKKRAKTQFEEIYDFLEKNRYIFEIYEGKGPEFLYLYTFIHCPHIVADRIASYLELHQKNASIHSFEIKPITNRQYLATIVYNEFNPCLSNYEKLLNNEIPCTKLKLWDDNDFPKKEVTIEKKDRTLLRFISILISNNLSSKGLFGVWLDELKKFLIDNNLDPNNHRECMLFLNDLHNEALNRKLINYRVTITPSRISASDLLVLRIICDPDEKTANKLINELSCFSWIGLLESYNEFYIILLSIPFDDPIARLITNKISSYNLDFEYFSISSRLSRFVPYFDLYDFRNNKWSFTTEKERKWGLG